MIVNVCASTAGGSTRLPTYYYETTPRRKSIDSTPEKKPIEKKEVKPKKACDSSRKFRVMRKIKNFFRSKSVQ
ncbi:hypothetical protein PRIPAC_73653 [Pristionchus pacificus]|uniref:Uncharacterized protein n=1 Tax=Pristionchus pacificus TaxID=54126 RepID=A0A2A6BRN3_PRIPA|nr:hypothetical protein PRIPAC_73653 [Pristionchus pacificus]|eukprot:PDM68565.1 hypothetical protein PRIPAC_44067 [Pristionchus pacificus]